MGLMDGVDTGGVPTGGGKAVHLVGKESLEEE